MTGNATLANRTNHFDSKTHCHSYSLEDNLSQELFCTMKTSIIMAECDLLDVLKSAQIITKLTKFLQEGCGCSHGMKGSQCCEQFSKEAVLSNLNNCLELSHEELDLVILANIKACTNSENTGEKRKQVCDPVSFTLTVRSAIICSYVFME